MNINPDHNAEGVGHKRALPAGQVDVGVTKAVKAMDVFHLTEAEARALFTSVAEDALRELRELVKGARPRGSFAVQVIGPKDDPIQGRIFGVSVWAPFALDDLDADSGAWIAHTQGGGSR